MILKHEGPKKVFESVDQGSQSTDEENVLILETPVR